MIVGHFDSHGRPFAVCRLMIPRLRVSQCVAFLVTTGRESTCLHPRDARKIGIPFPDLANRHSSREVGGRSAYFREPALLSFRDGDLVRIYEVGLLIADPNESDENVPSVLGRNVIDHWYMEYDPSEGRLEFTVEHADETIGAG